MSVGFCLIVCLCPPCYVISLQRLHSWDSKIKYIRTLNYSFMSNGTSVLEHIAHIFSIYYVELELHL
jgi:hypothetical protein